MTDTIRIINVNEPVFAWNTDKNCLENNNEHDKNTKIFAVKRKKMISTDVGKFIKKHSKHAIVILTPNDNDIVWNENGTSYIKACIIDHNGNEVTL